MNLRIDKKLIVCFKLRIYELTKGNLYAKNYEFTN